MRTHTLLAGLSSSLLLVAGCGDAPPSLATDGAVAMDGGSPVDGGRGDDAGGAPRDAPDAGTIDTTTGCGCGSTDPARPCLGRSATYEREGYTIEFAFECDGGDCACGRFATGWDFWVAPPTRGGTVTVTGMSPDRVGSGAALRNGAMMDRCEWTSRPSTAARSRTASSSTEPTRCSSIHRSM